MVSFSTSAARRLSRRDREAWLPARAAGVASQFLALGVRHILTGRLPAVPRRAAEFDSCKMPTTVTAFTVAHSMTLALAVLFVQVPAAVVEPPLPRRSSGSVSRRRGSSGFTLAFFGRAGPRSPSPGLFRSSAWFERCVGGRSVASMRAWRRPDWRAILLWPLVRRLNGSGVARGAGACVLRARRRRHMLAVEGRSLSAHTAGEEYRPGVTPKALNANERAGARVSRIQRDVGHRFTGREA